MYSLAITTSFLSVWCLFSVSSKVDYVKEGFTFLLSNNTKVAKLASLVFYLISAVLLVTSQGKFTGLISSTIVWSFMASSVLLFAPFTKRIKLSYIAFLFLIITAFELTTTYLQ